MHLNKILEQIKRHQSPTEAIDKLATALEKADGVEMASVVETKQKQIRISLV